MSKLSIRLAGFGALAAAGVLVFAAPAGASPARPVVAAARVSPAAGPAAVSLPKVKLTENKKGATKFVPSTLSVPSNWNGKNACTKRRASFRFRNRTSGTQEILANGTDFVSLAAGAATVVCSSNPTGSPVQDVFSVEGNTGSVTVTFAAN